MTIAMRGNAGGDSPQDPHQLPPQQPGTQTAPIPSQLQQTPTPGQNQAPSQSSPQSESQPQTPQSTEGGQGDGTTEQTVDQEPEFPIDKLASLDEMISRPRWVVPVLPKGELELLLEASIELCKKEIDVHSEACQRFFREGLTISFTKILTDEAVSGWKYEIHKCILKNAEKLIELCTSKLDQDWFPLLELLAMVLNPACKFHTYNGSRASETVQTSVQLSEDDLFARPLEVGQPKGWLVDLVNLFGKLNGFQILLDRFNKGHSLSVSLIAAFIKPFGLCFEVLTSHCVQKYFLPIIECVPKFLDGLTDEELNKETKNEAKNDALSGIIKSLKCLASRIPKQEEKVKTLEIFRLKMILRLLQISSFNGKMNALNEVNKVIANVSYYHHRHNQEEDEWLTAEKMAEWIQQNNVLSIVLRDSLHQPQYVEKLEKIIRFMIKEKALTLQDLDKIWEAQAGKHEAIEKNVHDLLAKLAWDFSPDQLDHLFECFQASWVHASKKQREKLLELIRRLAEDDKEGVMAHKVLGLLWNLAHSEDVPTDITDQALSAHIKILDYSCSQDRDAQKIHWISRFVDELKNDKWVLPALKQIKDICQLFTEPPQNFTHTQRTPHIYYRNSVINQLQNQHSIVMLVAQNLTGYMNKARQYAKENANMDPSNILPDGRYNHIQQVQERLRFLRFLLKDGQLWLCEPQAKQIWVCLAENAIYPCDRENCFRWFSKLMGEEPDLDPEITKDFFEQNILQFDPSLLTEHGINCFERFFKQVNSKERKLIPKRRGGYAMDDMNLVGIEYLWRVVLHSPDDVAEKAIYLLKECYTNLSPRLHSSQVDMHDDLVQLCVDHLRAAYDTISALDRDQDSIDIIYQEANRMIRVMTVLEEYVAECDEAYGEERAILPLGRACRGKTITLPIRFPNMNRLEDVDIISHTNETMGSVRRHVTQTVRERLHNQNVKVDLYVNGEIIDQNEDRKLVSQLDIRDKTLITGKVSPVGANMPSSPDSSSDSSTGSPHNMYEGPNIEAENCLPGVLMANNMLYAKFLVQLADLGCQIQYPRLQEGSRQFLKLMPADNHTVMELRRICQEHAKMGERSTAPTLEEIFFGSSPSHILYHLEVTYAQLMPANSPNSEEAFEFQLNFLKSGGVSVCLNMLTKNNFLPTADLQTRRAAYHVVLKIVKLLLTAVADAQYEVIASSCQGDASKISSATYNQGLLLHQALECIPNPSAERTTRMVAFKLGKVLKQQILSTAPDLNTVKSIQKIAWSACTGSLDLVHTSTEEIHKAHERACSSEDKKEPDLDDITVCREALEVLTVCLVVCPQALEALNKDKAWQTFIIDLLLLCKSRFVRVCASEQFFMMATRCCSGQRPLLFFITLLFTVLGTTAKEYAKQSNDYFQLLCRLLNYACISQASLPTAEVLLGNEIAWLKKVRDSVVKSGEAQVEEALLEGHLGITKELLSLQSPEKKYHIGAEKGGPNLIKELMEDFLFPASKIVIQCRKSKGELPSDNAVPVCATPLTTVAAYDLLVALCTNCVPNLKVVADMLHEMYYEGHDPLLTEWEYMPPVGPRPPNGFVGLKNAGATCYMNSVLQQLFMIDPIRSYILAAEGAAEDNLEDEEDDKPEETQSNLDTSETESQMSKSQTLAKGDERKDYNIGVLKFVQLIMSHLACSKLQYYVPRGFWKHFRLWGEPVNLREQHDALEFFNSLVDSMDEALKSLGYTPVLSKVMGGTFADQKICKDCPHRYSREESFTTLNIDIRNQQNLLESLEQYVKGDLLEGANAYHCEKCSKKVDTVKRLCIKKLPPILAIQLKRFDYDWERECAIKFNDYFEFPRELDMEPYTVQGLAKIEGELIADDDEGFVEKSRSTCTKYRLVGVVVHSGQASGGHYYSYILHRHGEQPPKWYKFDDGEVTECKMDDDEEIKNQCFGGEYLGEVFDHMMKRMSLRRQKRWWNAYILIYEREDGYQSVVVDELTKSIEDLTLAVKTSQYKMPAAIEKCVRKQSIRYMHNKNHFSLEYFQFMRKLLLGNVPYVQLPAGQDKLTPESEDLAMISVQLVSKFLFNVGFHTKKTLRGPATEWYDALTNHLRHSKLVRNWFAQNVLFTHPSRFAEYLLESPSSEVRNAFMRILVFLAHFCMADGPCPSNITPVIALNDPSATLSDHILVAVLSLLKKEVSEHGRHLPQYFHLFYMYANLGTPQKQQLLKLGIPATFMQVALDEGPGPPIKYQYADLGKLYSVVSMLVRCCDITTRCQSSVAGQPPLPNPYWEQSLKQPLVPIQPEVADILFTRPSYVKKLLEDCNNTEETAKLLRFCCWENPHFSSTVLSELLWQVAYSYTYELRPYLDLLLQMLLLEDSWQNHRIHNALKGIPDDRDGLFDTIHHSKGQHQKRAYQCIKMLVKLFIECQASHQMLQTNVDLKRKWTFAVEWLSDELEKRPYSGNAQYSYSSWSPPAQSNETSNGYYLERSHSARMTLTKACELCPEEEPEEPEYTEGSESPQMEDTATQFTASTTAGTTTTTTTATSTTTTATSPSTNAARPQNVSSLQMNSPPPSTQPTESAGTKQRPMQSFPEPQSPAQSSSPKTPQKKLTPSTVENESKPTEPGEPSSPTTVTTTTPTGTGPTTTTPTGTGPTTPPASTDTERVET